MIEPDDDAKKVMDKHRDIDHDTQPWALISLCSAAIYWSCQRYDPKNVDALVRFLENHRHYDKWRPD